MFLRTKARRRFLSEQKNSARRDFSTESFGTGNKKSESKIRLSKNDVRRPKFSKLMK